jgi:tRNA-Thr(GGU) m(6)t(6)A37 methyltransferase TsaA
MESVTFRPIGIIHTPFVEPKGTPIQPRRSAHAKGQIEIFREFVPGLRDLDGFSHIYLIYRFHLSSGYELEVTPFLDDKLRGLFATRAPRRPNGIGLSVVRLVAVDGGTLDIEDVDMIDGTPLLDIKPFVPEFESVTDFQIGWLEGKVDRADDTSDDGRFRA